MPTWAVDNKVVDISTPAVLVAGSTSSVRTFQLQDRYSNPTPVVTGQEDSPGQGILFDLISDSGGNFGFSSPSTDTFSVGNGTARLALNQHTTTYYLCDTLAGTHNKTIEEGSGSRGWEVAVQTYTIVPAPPTKIIFDNPQRKLVAGSTSTYVVDISTPYFRVQTRDDYDNIAPVDTVEVIDVNSDSRLGEASVTPELLDSFNSIYGSNALSLTFTPGTFQREFYYRDQVTGFPNISAVHQDRILVSATQQAVITPNKAHHLSLHHPYNITSPLSVRNEGVINVKVRDQYENLADGGAQIGENNGLTYNGVIRISHSGSTNTVVLSGDGVGISSLTFIQSATNYFTLSDIIQETLTLNATDSIDATINGMTGLEPSDGHVITTGLVGFPTDMAPEPAGPGRSTFKDAILVPYALSQGEGSTVDRPYPVSMLRLRVEVEPDGVNSYAVWKGLRVRKMGTLPNEDVIQISLWRDMGFRDGVFDIAVDGDGVEAGIPVASGTFLNVAGENICDLDFSPSSQTITTNYQQYFITIRISTKAAEGRTLGVQIKDSSDFTIPALESTARIAENNFPMQSYVSPIVKSPAPIMLKVDNVAAYFNNQTNGTVPQGTGAAAFLKLGFWAREFEGNIDKIRVTRIGTGSDLDVSKVSLYFDGTTGNNGDGLFQPGADTLIESTLTKFSTNAATLDITPNVVLDGTTKYFFLVYGIADSASIGSTLGVRIPARTDIILGDGVMVDYLQDPDTQTFPVLSSQIQIVATTDKLVINPVPESLAAATQGDTNVPVVRLDMYSDNHTVILQGIRIDRKNVNLVNRPEDVSDIKVYYDVDGDLNLNPDLDQIVTPVGKPIVFKTTQLRVALSAANQSIAVDSVEDFPPAPGRLVLEDNTGLREVVIYNSIDSVFNEFNNVIRGAEGTTPAAHGVGAAVHGQAFLPILGPYNGQEILKNSSYRVQTILTQDMTVSSQPASIGLADTTELPPSGSLQIGNEVGISYTSKCSTGVAGVSRASPVTHMAGELVQGAGRNKSYFIAYDIHPLAVPGRLVGKQTVLGLNIPSTSYIVVGSPDGVNPIPSFNAEIGDILEYGDTVTMVSTEAITGPTLQQNAENQPIMTIFATTNKSEAYWNGLIVHSTGTTLPSEIECVRLWYDQDNNGIFSATNDILVSSGTFGNAGEPKKCQLSFSDTPKIIVTSERGTSENISRRFFITVDIESLATPETTFGIWLEGPSDFSMVSTPPNFDVVGSTGLPYACNLRTIIPSPRIVTIEPTLILSNSIGNNNVPVLDQPIDAAQTSDISIYPPTLMWPATGYVVIGSEVLKYDAKTPGFLQLVTRGVLGTSAQAHSGGEWVGTSYTQGDVNNGFMKLLVSCNGFNVRWFALKVNRYLPPGSIKGSDQDVTRIRIWRDNGNGTLDRDPATGQIPLGTETLLGEKALGTGYDPAGTALISLNDPALNNPGFVLINSVPTTYWITVDVDPTAFFDDLLALRIQSDTSFVVGALTPNDGIHSVSTNTLPIATPGNIILPTEDTMEVTIEDLTPPEVQQAQQNVPMARINLKTNANTAVWNKLRIDLVSDSGAVSGDISLIKLFKDVGNDGFFGVEETSKTINGEYINLLSLGTEVFTDMSTELTIDPQIIESAAVSNKGQNYFLTYDISPFAQVGVNVGVQIGGTNYFTIGYPDLVQMTNYPIFGRAAIQEAVDKVTLSVDNVAKTLANLGGTYQAATRVPILRFNLTTDISQAYWEGIRVERTGASADPAFPYGHNSDVKYVHIWKDVNFNDQLDASDALLSSATTQFNLADDNDRIKTIPLNNPVLLSPTPQSFFISYDIGEGAEAGASIGVKLGDRSWITVSHPNEVDPIVKVLTFGATQQAFPYETSLIPINAIQVHIEGQSLAPAQIPQLSSGVPMLMFSMNTDRNFVTLQELILYQTGTVEESMDGQGDVAAVTVWRDDGNTIFEPGVDTFLGTVLHAATTYYANGIAHIQINGTSGTIVGTDVARFFVTVDVGDVSLTGRSVRGHTFGLKVKSFGDFRFTPATAGADPAINYDSLISNKTLILDENATIVAPVSLLPTVWLDPFGDGYPALDEGGVPQPRSYDSLGVPMVDVDADGENDITLDIATELPGIDLDGDGLIEVDMTRDGLLDVDFNGDGKPDDVIPDLNGDGVPEIDLSKDGYPEFGYIPEKWTRETSKIYTKWARINNPLLEEYQVGLGVNNLSNNVTDSQVPEGWFSTGKLNSYELTNLTLLAAEVTKLAQGVPIDKNPPFDLYVQNGEGFLAEDGQIQVGSEIMGYSVRVANTFAINKRGETFGTPRQDHLLNERVTNEGYVVRARAVTSGNVFGAQSAVKFYRVDVSPPIVPGKPISDQELAGGKPSPTGVFSVKWSASADLEAGVRAYQIQERVDNDPVWKTIRMVHSTQLSFLVGNGDCPSNKSKPANHFYQYRVRAINQAGGASEWSPASESASTGFPTEPITKVTNYPNPVDTRKEPTNVAYILNDDSTVKITLFDLLGYQVRQWEFGAGQNGGKAGPNVFKWDGSDDAGRKVAAGGYIMRIEVIGAKGSTVVIRKIGIIN